MNTREKIEAYLMTTFGRFYAETEKRNFFHEADSILSYLASQNEGKVEEVKKILSHKTCDSLTDRLCDAKVIRPDACSECMARQICQLFSQPEVKWETNPWVWRYSFELIPSPQQGRG